MKCKEHTPKVIGSKDDKDLFTNVGAPKNSNKNHTTVIGCVSASGDRLPLSFVSKIGQTISADHMHMFEYMNTSSFYSTKTGYSDANVTNTWFVEDFLYSVRKIIQQKSENPDDTTICLFIDGASCHLSPELVELAINNNVHIIVTPSHTTVHFQALDVRVFGIFKKELAKKIAEFEVLYNGSSIPHIFQMHAAYYVWENKISSKLSRYSSFS